MIVFSVEKMELPPPPFSFWITSLFDTAGAAYRGGITLVFIICVSLDYSPLVLCTARCKPKNGSFNSGFHLLRNERTWHPYSRQWTMVREEGASNVFTIFHAGPSHLREATLAHSSHLLRGLDSKGFGVPFPLHQTGQSFSWEKGIGEKAIQAQNRNRSAKYGTYHPPPPPLHHSCSTPCPGCFILMNEALSIPMNTAWKNCALLYTPGGFPYQAPFWLLAC